MSNINVYFKKLSKGAIEPKRNKDTDAGYDLFAVESAIINPFERKIIRTDIAVEIPPGCYGRIAPRSGLAAKFGIDILAGVVDSGYRDGLGVVMINLNCAELVSCILRGVSFNSMFGLPGKYEVKAGDKIAQIIFETCHDAKLIEVDELSISERGTCGFGSSGMT